MSPRSFLRAVLFVLLAGSCPSLTGCFGGWAYPSVSVITPAARIPNKEEVRAFRVDVKDDLIAMDVGEHDRYELSEISAADRLTPQVKVAVDHGWFMLNAISFGQHTQYTLKVRLYRPGYETVEINSWELVDKVEWKKAKSLREQEEAIDALVSTWETKAKIGQEQYWQSQAVPEKGRPVRPNLPVVFDALAPGSTAKAHRDALLFAASEYERLRLSAIPTCEKAIRERANEKPENVTVSWELWNEQQRISERSADKAAKLRALAAE
jgi:hypothetical protein